MPHSKNPDRESHVDAMRRLLKEKAERPLLRDLKDEQLKLFMVKKFSERRIYYEQAELVIEEDLASVESLIQNIMHV